VHLWPGVFPQIHLRFKFNSVCIRSHPKALFLKTFAGKTQKAISHEVYPASLLDVSAGNFQRALVDDSETIKTLMATRNRSKMVAVQGSPYAPAPLQ
jgi:hypothetical protein